MHGFPKFLFLLAIVSVAFAIILFFFIPGLPEKFRFEEWWKILVFFILTTTVFHFGLIRSTVKKPASMAIYYLATSTFKLLLYLGVIIGYALLHKERAPAFISTFFLMYVVYTIFEVGILYKKFRTPKTVNKA